MTWKKFKKGVITVVTFGAQGRIERKISERDKEIQKLYKKTLLLSEERNNANLKLKQLFNLKKTGYKLLLRIKKIILNFALKDRIQEQENFEHNNNVKVEFLETSISMGNKYLSGSGIGLATTSGVWALVGSCGTASTGTAISSLSGAAASNATLAWFGGGSLATGGGGMAIGTVVLGTVAGVVVIATVGILAHVKAGKVILEIEKDINKILEEQEIQETLIEKVNLIAKRTEEIIYVLSKETLIIEGEINKTLKIILPFGFLSVMFRKIKKFFTGKYFNEREYVIIQQLLLNVRSYLEILDLKIIDESGNPLTDN